MKMSSTNKMIIIAGLFLVSGCPSEGSPTVVDLTGVISNQ